MQIDPGHPLARGLLAYWLINERSGAPVHDASAYHHTGTIVDAVRTAEGVRLTADEINFGLPATLLPAYMTVTLRIKMNAGQSGFGTLFGARYSYGLWFALDSAEKLTCYINNSSWTGIGAALAVGTWYTVGATWDGKVARAYVDGIQVGSNDFADAVLNWTSATSLQIGRDMFDNYALADTTVAWAAVHNRALMAAEMARFSAAPFAMFGAELLPPLCFVDAGGPAGLSIPVAQHHYQQMRGAA